jgi:hypothetical protein
MIRAWSSARPVSMTARSLFLEVRNALRFCRKNSAGVLLPRKHDSGASLPTFKTSPVADLHRRGGHVIAQRAEDEQAFVLHWLIRLVLRHGSAWRAAAGAELDLLAATSVAANPVLKGAPHA